MFLNSHLMLVGILEIWSPGFQYQPIGVGQSTPKVKQGAHLEKMLISKGLVIKFKFCIVVPTLQLKEWVFNSATIVVPITTTALIALITALVDAIAVFYNVLCPLWNLSSRNRVILVSIQDGVQHGITFAAISTIPRCHRQSLRRYCRSLRCYRRSLRRYCRSLWHYR